MQEVYTVAYLHLVWEFIVCLCIKKGPNLYIVLLPTPLQFCELCLTSDFLMNSISLCVHGHVCGSCERHIYEQIQADFGRPF